MARLDVRKTYKLYIGGAFPRSESGRTYEVRSASGAFLANAAAASRKDARDAVGAALAAQPKWAAATAYNRGQILYRVAEMLEGRRDQFVAEVGDAEGLSADDAAALVDAAIDRWVWYAGWSDKIAQVAGNANPVAGPYFNLSVPEPTGVVAVLAPQASSLLGLVSVVAPVVVSGNTCVVLASQRAAAACDHALGGAGDVGPAGRRRERAHRVDGGGRALAGLARGGAGARPRRRRAAAGARPRSTGARWSLRRRPR